MQTEPIMNRLDQPFKTATLLVVLSGVLAVIIVIATLQGAYTLSVREVFGQWWGESALDTMSYNVLMYIRLPRIVMAVVVGAALSVAGATMQALFRNPLAEPGLVGLSAGASLGAVCAIVLTSGSFAVVSLSAFVGAWVATYAAYQLGRRSQGASGLLLAGIAMNTIVFSVMGLLIVHANDAQLRDVTFWNMGSLAGASWSVLFYIIPLVGIGSGLLIRRWKLFNALLLGDRETFHLGFNLAKLRWQTLMLVALTVGPLVAVTGTIGFVGLVVPHLVRLLAGSDHRWVMPASALVGAAALVLSDALARTVMAPAELPIGLITSLVGGPFFMVLILRSHRSGR